jgi:hypothetical protein
MIFLLYLTPLFTRLRQTYQNITCPSYIDDIFLMTEGTSAADNGRELEDPVDTSFRWVKKAQWPLMTRSQNSCTSPPHANRTQQMSAEHNCPMVPE